MEERATVKETVISIDRLVPGIYSKYNKVKAREFARYGLTPPQTAILLLLHKNGAMRVSDIAAAMEMVDSNVSNICSRLEKMNLVRRNRPDDNRRVVVIEPTEAAQAQMTRVVADQHRFARRMGRRVSRDDLERIEACLTEMNRMLDLILSEDEI